MNIGDVKVTKLFGVASSASATLGTGTSVLPSASLAKKECLLVIDTVISSGAPVWTVALSEASSSSGSYTKVAGVSDFTTISTSTTTAFAIRPKYEYLRFEVSSVATAGSGAITATLLHYNREST